MPGSSGSAVRGSFVAPHQEQEGKRLISGTLATESLGVPHLKQETLDPKHHMPQLGHDQSPAHVRAGRKEGVQIPHPALSCCYCDARRAYLWACSSAALWALLGNPGSTPPAGSKREPLMASVVPSIRLPPPAG